jgi:O-antigen/teichoic acid export membrane protein
MANALVFLGICVCVAWKIGIRVSRSLMPELMRFGFPQICSQSTELVMSSIGVYLLNYFAGLEVVAVYSLGYKLAQILVITAISPFSLAFEPYVFSNRERLDHKTLIARSLTYMVLAVVFASFGLLMATRIMLPKIAPPEYASTFLVVLMLIPGMAFMGVCYFGQTILNAMNRTRVIGIASLSVVSFSCLINFLLIRQFNWYGAVLSFDASFILLGLILTAFALKHSSIPLERKRVVYLGILLTLLMMTLFVLRELPMVRFIVIGVLVVFLSILLLLYYGFFHNDEKLVVRQLAAKLC